jgi:hypothetical protein
VVGLTGASEIPKAIEKAMGSLGAVIRDVLLNSTGMRIFIARCTPRNLSNFNEYAQQALVSRKIMFLKLSK